MLRARCCLYCLFALVLCAFGPACLPNSCSLRALFAAAAAAAAVALAQLPHTHRRTHSKQAYFDAPLTMRAVCVCVPVLCDCPCLSSPAVIGIWLIKSRPPARKGSAHTHTSMTVTQLGIAYR